jgi:ribonuclease P protein component
LGIVISRRYGNAVARNRAKRIIREAFRRCAPDLPKADIIVRPTEACRGAGVEEIVQALIDGVNQSIHREECR